MGALLFDKVFIIILIKYFDYGNIFSVEYIIKFLKYNRMNNHTFKLKKDK